MKKVSLTTSTEGIKGASPVKMPEITSKVKFLATSSGSLQEGEGQRSGYPAPLHKKIASSKF